MAITRDEVLHVARLAQLALSEDEIERLEESYVPHAISGH
jgi:Asp-tRNA(Asn)/Glu-tRNA(Gln) amidotransferase C subunit